MTVAKTLGWGLTFGAIIAVLVIGWRLSGLPYLDTPDKVFYDLRHALFAKQEAAARPEFAIVSISETTLDGYPAVKPVDRRLLARLITELRDADVRAIGLAFQFDRPTTPEVDRELAEAIRSMGERIAVGVIDTRSQVAPQNLAEQERLLSQAPLARRGHLYFDGQKSGVGQQPDLTVRFLARRSGNSDEVPDSLAEALLSAADLPMSDIGQTRIVPEDQPGPHIAWTKPTAANRADTFTRIDLPDHGGSAATGPILPAYVPAIVRGRVVIIGADVETNDRHLTPFSVWSGQRMTSAEIHTQIAAQLMDGRRVATLTLPVEFALAMAIAVTAFLVGYVRGFRPHRPHAIWGNADYFLVGIPLSLIAVGAFALENMILPTDTMLYAALGGIIAGHIWYNSSLPTARAGPARIETRKRLEQEQATA